MSLKPDELGSIYEDESFGDLSPNSGQPAEAQWRLAPFILGDKT